MRIHSTAGEAGRKSVEQELAGRSEADLLEENAKLRAQLLQAQQDVEILQEALGFFAKRRRQ